MQTVLGIDPGYERCGYAIIKKEKGFPTPTIIDLGVIKTDAKDAFELRLHEIGRDLSTLIKNHQPDLVSLEDLFFVQNTTTGLRVAEVRGVVTYLATNQKIPLIQPKPVEVKSFFTGHGKATKRDMLKSAALQFELPQNPMLDDAIDALAMAYFGLHHGVSL